MVIKSYLSLFMLFVALPIFVVCVNVDAFFVLMSILILLMSSQSLKNLFIINFGSDNKFYEMEQKFKYRQQTMDSKSIKLNKVMVFMLNILFIIFFVYTYFVSQNIVLKFISVIITANWIYDLLKTIDNSLNHSKEINDDTWTLKDNIAEIFIWFHNISTIIFVIVMFGVKFL